MAGNANRKLRALQRDFPAFTCRLIDGWNGKQFEAVRTSGPGDPGLFVVISADVREVEAELRHDADGLRRAA